MRIRRNPELPMTQQHGEATVVVGTQVIALEPIQTLMVNFADRWVELSTLVGLTMDVVDPDNALPDVDNTVRMKLIELIAAGVLETDEDVPGT